MSGNELYTGVMVLTGEFVRINQLRRQCRALALFFADFERFLALKTSVPAAERLALIEEYDNLFKGCRDGIHIPLWASACCPRTDGSGEDALILLDKTTLALIKSYRAWNYDFKTIDGNPPDFIGEMFHFVSFLHKNALGALLRGKEAAGFEHASSSFISSFLETTAKRVAKGIREHSKTKLFLEIADELAEISVPDPSSFTPLSNTPFSTQSPSKNKKIKKLTVNSAGRNNCGGKCAVQLDVEEGCVTALRSGCGLTGEPVMRACMRGLSYRETFLDSRRLRYPMQRTGERGEGRFRRISWEAAAEISAEAMMRVRKNYGPGAIYLNYATGISAVLKPNDFAKRLLNLDGGHLSFYNSYSSACAQFVTPYIYGDNFSGNSLDDILNTKLLILWGHNPRETIFGSERNHYIKEAMKRGVRIIVIDPRESDSVRAYKAEWIGIRPGADAALADAMAYIIWSEGLHDRRFMDSYCQGFDEEHLPAGIPANESYAAYLFGKKDGISKTPAWAESITGVDAALIAALARDYARAKPACILPGLGPQRTGNGEQTVRTIAALCALTGNIGIPGGGAAGMGFIPTLPWPQYPVPPNPYPGMIPSFLWTRAVERGVEMNQRNDGLRGVEKLDSNIKLILNLAGNTLINQHSDINKTGRLLKDTRKSEFILCSDVFMTPSARFADILLPGTSFFEEDNITKPFDFGDYILFNRKAIEPLFGCRSEYAFFADLARLLGHYDEWSAGKTSREEWLPFLYNDFRSREKEFPLYDDFKARGGYHKKEAGNESQHYVAYADNVSKGHPFATPSGKIEIFSRALYDMGRPDEVPAIPCYLPCAEGPGDPLEKDYPLQLIGWHTKRRTHSTGDLNRSLEKAEPQRLWMNPADAAMRGIAGGDTVEAWNGRGRIRVPVHVSARILRGVVALAQGAWHTPDTEGVDTRGSINVLTSQNPTPLARGNPQHTNLVEVRGLKG
jgi:anaerobic dimethyl sulfoxide reductase subunit A